MGVGVDDCDDVDGSTRTASRPRGMGAWFDAEVEIKEARERRKIGKVVMSILESCVCMCMCVW